MMVLKQTVVVLAVLGGLGVAGCAGPGAETDGMAVSSAMTPGADYVLAARQMSGGSVEMYSLDGAPAPLDPMDELAAPMGGDDGMPYAGDPAVTLYPVDDGALPPLAGRPPLAPPSGVYRPMPSSPFDGMVPPPVDAPENRSGDLSRIYFGHGSAQMDAQGQGVLDRIVQGASGEKMTVSGYASSRAETPDPVERSIVNLKMSMDRAFAVSSGLIRKGVPPAMIETRAYGDAWPSAAEDGAEQENRRVDIRARLTGPAVSSSSESPIPPLARYE